MERREPVVVRDTSCGLFHRHLLQIDKTAPLAFLVHGRAGNDQVMWAFRRCIPEYWSIIAPEAPDDDHQVVPGKSWWQVDGDPKGIPASATKALPLLQNFTSKSLSLYQLRPRFIVGIGFSQGAGMLSTFLQIERGFFCGVALLAGFVVRLPDQKPFTAPLPQVLMAHGTNDERVSLEEARRGLDYIRSLGAVAQFVEDPVGHKVGVNGMKALTAWCQNLDQAR